MTHWNEHAKQWEAIGTPLRPSGADINLATSWVNEVAALKAQPLSVLLLGVTPELVKLSWPAGTKLIVADNNLDMINNVLPVGEPQSKPLVVATCWRALSLATSSIDLVIGDGCYNVLAEEHYDELSREIIRVLGPGGSLITRFFIRPENNESLEELLQDVMTGTIKNFNVFKWRLAMALHGTFEQGVCLQDIWKNWDDKFKKYRQWPETIMQTINNYKNAPSRYTFPTLSELRNKLEPYFAEEKLFLPTYTLGERCPTFKFIKKITW